MYNQDPMKPSSVPAWNASTETERLGFALRDKRTTEAISTPMVIPKMGYCYQSYISHYPTPVVGVSPQHMAVWPDQNSGLATIPGILTLDFEPIYALSDPNMRAETADIFTNIWTLMRVLNNMTRDFQPQDMQIIFCAVMELKMHLANLRRILNIMKKVINHELNAYYSGPALIKSLGFDITETEMRQNWENWWQFYNVTLLGLMKKIRWFTNDFVPGQDRWAGLCKEIYKDNPAYTDYCQVYMLKPKYFTNMWATWDATNNAYLWTFEKQPYQQFDRTGSIGGTVAFADYLDKVYTLIRNVFYDDSTATIIATMNALAERNLDGSVKTEFLTFEEIPWDGEDVKLTYDFNMLLAIHNATICDAVVHEPIQNIEDGTLEQNVTIPTTSATYYKSQAVQLFPKVINLPNFGATTADMINATQWTVTNQPYGLSSEAVYMRPGSMGTELITRMTIWSYFYNQITNTSVLTGENMYTSIIDMTPTGESQANVIARLRSEMFLLIKLMNFAFAPILYQVNMEGASTTEPGKVYNAIGQMEVQYVGDYGTLSNIHKQFVRNFWGYPFDTPEQGSFATAYNEDKRK